MATTTPVREYSLDYYLLEKLKFSGLEKENLTDLVSIVSSLKNKYGIAPHAVHAVGLPVRNGLAVHYQIDSIALHKLMNVLFDTPRLERVSIIPRGIPRSMQYDLEITIA